MSKQKLELTWIGKENQPVLEPRILIEDPDKSYGDNSADNMLIFGDNLLALKALEQDFAGKIKCIYIDPPYNTGAAFAYYDDGVEQSLWLSLMRDRLLYLHNLLNKEGIIFCSIDASELFYLGALFDEIFGRTNRIEVIAWKKSYGGGAKSKYFVNQHEFILCYAKELSCAPLLFLPADKSATKYYKYKDDKFETRGPYRLQPLATTSMDDRPNLRYPIIIENGIEIWPDKQWQWSKERVSEALKNDEIVISQKQEKYIVSYKQYLKNEDGDERLSKPKSVIEGAYTQHGTYESIRLFGLKNKFSFPKPESLIWQLIECCTISGDWILDSFIGSGTTAAVAHKMGRRWIGIELGEHCHTHCLPRLKQVVDGTDQGGISKAVNWKGGAGFKYYYLAPSLLKQDTHGNWIIDDCYNPDMLAAAMAKHEGFRYDPDTESYWKQGRSTEKDFIFTTTQFVTLELLDKLHEEMKQDESLLICCKSFSKSCEGRFSNIDVKKIPNMLLGRCEFGREDYSLNIINMPVDQESLKPNDMTDGTDHLFPSEATLPEKRTRRKKKSDNNQLTLFDT